MTPTSKAIREALARAEPLGLIRSLVDFGPEARELIVETVGSEVEGPFVHAVLVGFGEAASARQDPGSAPEEPRRSGAGSSAPPHGLTRRELSVLELLQHRLTNKEIATRLWITAESVRKYTVTIYRKLGVGSRRQAVAAALARGLLTEDEQQLAD